MTNLARVKVEWSGWNGGPGVNVLHFSQGTSVYAWDQASVATLLDELGTAYAGLDNMLFNTTKVKIPDQAEIIDSGTGQIIDIVSRGSGQSETIIGKADVAMPPQDMLLFRLTGDEFKRGRLVKGRIFIGPVATTAADPDGTVKDSVVASVPAMWTALTSGVGSRLAVYHRPAVGALSGGDWTDVVSVTCWGKFATLASRRD